MILLAPEGSFRPGAKMLEGTPIADAGRLLHMKFMRSVREATLAVRTQRKGQLMSINIPMLGEETPKVLGKMLNLEASQLSLPESTDQMKLFLGLYAVLQAVTQSFDHSIIGSIGFGVGSAAILYGATFYLLRYMKEEHKFVRTLTALAATGAMAAGAYIVLHMIVGVALPPPLPTERLARFLLFPILMWTAFMYAFLFRHVSLRSIPAFCTAAFYVLAIEVFLSALAR